MKFIFALLFLAPLCSALTLEHKSLSLNSNNRVCGLREFSKKRSDTYEYLPTILDGWKILVWHKEGYISVGTSSPKEYVDANHPLNDGKPIYYTTVAGSQLMGRTSADVKNFYRLVNFEWIKIATDMQDCVEFKLDLTLGHQKQTETTHDLEITDGLADGKIVFKDEEEGYASRAYPISKYTWATKSPYFAAKFVDRFGSESANKDEPHVILCNRMDEEIERDFVTCMHQNKLYGQRKTDCMYDHMVKLPIERLVGLLDLADMCMVDIITKPGERAVLDKVKESKNWNDMNLALDYAKWHDNGRKLEGMGTLLFELTSERESWAEPPKADNIMGRFKRRFGNNHK